MAKCLASDFVVLVLSETVLSATVLVLDGCLSCDDPDRGSRQVAVTCGPMGWIAILARVEHEHEHEHEHEKQPKQNHAPKWQFGRAQF